MQRGVVDSSRFGQFFPMSSRYPPVYSPLPLSLTQRLVVVFRVFLVPYFLKKIWKRILHIVTGKSEIERILSTPATAGWRTLFLCPLSHSLPLLRWRVSLEFRLDKSLFFSKKLAVPLIVLVLPHDLRFLTSKRPISLSGGEC